MNLIDPKVIYDKMENNWKRGFVELHVSDIDQIPRIDAEPVRHGHWIHCSGKSSLWHCSECGETIMYNPTPKTYQNTKSKPPVYQKNRYCRACGVKMEDTL